MATKIAIINSALSTSTGTQDFTTTDFANAEDIDAAIVEVVGATSYGSVASHLRYCFGFTDGVRSRCSYIRSRDNQNTTDTLRIMSDTNLIHIINTTDTSVNGTAEFSSWIDNGIRINITDAFASAYKIKITLFSGVSAYVGTVTSDAGEDVAKSITDPGFSPDQIIIHSAKSLNSVTDTASLTIGVCGNDLTQGFLDISDVDNVFTSITSAYVSNQYVYFGYPSTHIEITDILSNGFEITQRDAAGTNYFSYLALKYEGGLNHNIVHYTSPVSDGNITTTGIGFTPQYVMTLMISDTVTLNVLDNTNIFGIGVSSFTNNSESCISIASEDNSASSDTQSNINNEKSIELFSNTGTLTHQATFVSFNSDGYTLNYGYIHPSYLNANPCILLAVEASPTYIVSTINKKTIDSISSFSKKNIGDITKIGGKSIR